MTTQLCIYWEHFKLASLHQSRFYLVQHLPIDSCPVELDEKLPREHFFTRWICEANRFQQVFFFFLLEKKLHLACSVIHSQPNSRSKWKIQGRLWSRGVEAFNMGVRDSLSGLAGRAFIHRVNFQPFAAVLSHFPSPPLPSSLPSAGSSLRDSFSSSG